VMPATRGLFHPPFEPIARHLIKGDPLGATAHAPSTTLRAPFANFDPRIVPPHNFGTDVLHDDRWGKFFENFVQGWGAHPEGTQERADKQRLQERIRLRLGQWICRVWNGYHGDTDLELLSFDFVIYIKFNEVPNCPLGASAHNVSEEMVWQHTCFAPPAAPPEADAAAAEAAATDKAKAVAEEEGTSRD
jgi:hypothetical protein